MIPFDRQSRVTLTPRSRHRSVLDEGLVMRQRDGELMVVNEVGSRVLEGCTAKLTIQEILDRLVLEFDVPEEDLARDVLAYLEELRQLDVVETVQ